LPRSIEVVAESFEQLFPKTHLFNSPDMSVHIQLNNPPPFYTNLDDLSGRVILNLTSNENISAIMVKLEGESKTVLPRPPGGQQSLDPSLVTQRDQRQGTAKEDHKLLYIVIKVFPSKGLLKQGDFYMIRAGQHEYPFQFKIPLNNICCDPDFQNDHPETFKGGFYNQIPSASHIKATLPPSLTSLPGEAEIRYFVKATVQRPSRFKGNRRCEIGFKFMPIEPPKAPPTTSEVYARRPYLFTNKIIQMNESSMPKGEVDARLPSPAVLTCNKPVPLRLVMRNYNEAKKQVYLLFFQMNLIGLTQVRALDVKRSEFSFWVIVRADRLAIPIGSPGDGHGTETVVDPRLWNHVPLPNTVTPSFRACNLMRSYELEIRVGLGCESPGDASVCYKQSVGENLFIHMNSSNKRPKPFWWSYGSK
jgi:hypothetical protein